MPVKTSKVNANNTRLSINRHLTDDFSKHINVRQRHDMDINKDCLAMVLFSITLAKMFQLDVAFQPVFLLV